MLKNWCFWTVLLEKTFESPLDCKEISPGCSLEGLMLRLKLQSLGHLMRRSDSFEKTLMLGKTEGGRRRGQQRMRWLDGITDSMDMSLSELRECVTDREALACCSPWGRKESNMSEWLNQTELSYVTLSNAVPCYFPSCYKSTFYFWWKFNPQRYNKVELLGEVFSAAKTTWFSQYIFP